MLCLINRARGRWHLPPLRESSRLDFAAQFHVFQMVGEDQFSHTVRGRGSTPGQRIDLTGFRWSAFGETISTGYATPGQAVAGWLGSREHCRILLSPVYRDIGVGVSPRSVRGVASRPGTWTADFALSFRRRAPSGNWAPANGCPY